MCWPRRSPRACTRAPWAVDDTAADGRPAFLAVWSQPPKAPAARARATTRAAASATASRPPRVRSAVISERRRDQKDPEGADGEPERQPAKDVAEVVDPEIHATETEHDGERHEGRQRGGVQGCLLYTSDAADDLLCVDLGGRRIIKKKKKK